jgi:pyruvate formate lyase activating enzyme
MVFDIARFAIHDGPGVRTTVFLKGCPLRCVWCHNPESMGPDPELAFSAGDCIGCGACVGICPQGVHTLHAGRHTLDRRRCVACGACVGACPATALEMIGRRMSIEEVMGEVLKDKTFYAHSGGGITLSGGEPMSQFAFTRALLRRARREGLHTCLDTSGAAAWPQFSEILPWVDLFLYDIKAFDERTHLRLTGASNRRILHNLRRLHAAGAKIRLRLPLVPGLNTSARQLAAYGGLAASLPGIDGVDVLPYHRLGRSKAERFGYTGRPAAKDRPLPSDAEVEAWLAVLRASGAPDAQIN